MQVTPSSSALFCGLTGANSQGPTPSEPQGPAMCLAGQDMTPAAPSTLVGYNKPLQVNDDALTRVGYNKPLLLNTADSTSPHTSLNPQPCAPAAPGNAATRADKAAAPGSAAAHSTAPKADPMEIAALELLLAEPANQDMVQHFGGPLKPLPTDTATGQGIQARYGADLGARLSQLQTAQQAVRAEYCKAMDSAMQSPGPNTPGSVHVPATGSGETAEPARWDFDPAAFTRQYASGDSPAQKAFAQLHGSDPLQYKEGKDIDGAAPSAYVLDSFKLEPGYDTHSEWSHDDWKGTRLEQPEHLLSPDHHTKLINKEYLWFDPVHGWSTEGENLKGNWLDRAFPMVVGGLISTFMLPPLQVGMSNLGLGTVTQGAVAGATSSAVIQLTTTGKVNFGTMLRSALTAGVSTGIMDASSMGDMLKSSELGTRALAHLGKAGIQGVLQQAIGGKFKDGFANSLLSSAASEVGAHLDQQIKTQLPELDPAQASALKLLSRAATSALRIAGSNDPAASFANDFLMGALQDAAADRKRGQEGRDGQEGAQDKPEGSTASSGLGLKPPRDWVDRLGRSSLGPRVSDEALSRWSDEIDGGIALNGSMAPGQISQAVVGPNQGPLAALAAAGLDAQQQRAMYGQLLANGQIQLNAQGVPIVQPGQVLEFDLSDMGGSTLGGHAIGRESAMRAQRETAEAAARASAAREGMSAEEAGDIYMAYGGRSASYTGLKPTWSGRMVDIPGGSVDAMGNPTGMPEQVWMSDQPSSSYAQAMGNAARTVGNLVDGAVQLGVNGAITNMVVRPASSIAALPAIALGTDAYTQIQADLQERWSPESNNPGAVAIRNSLGQMLEPVGQTIQQLRDASERRLGDGWTTAGFAAAQGALEVGGFLGGAAAIPAGRIALGNLGNSIRGGFNTLADTMPAGSGDAVRGGAAFQRGAVGELTGTRTAISSADDAATIRSLTREGIFGANGGVATGTVLDSIKATQPTYPGSAIPRSFEMTLPNGQNVWVAGNATEHMAEFAQMKAVNYTPEAVRLASQEQLTSLQAAVNTATQNGVPYNQLINVGGWELKFAPPRQPGQLPSLIHALPGQ